MTLEFELRAGESRLLRMVQDIHSNGCHVNKGSMNS
jgi:hypothetical protein